MALTLKENMLMVYQHQKPEYLPLTTDIDQVFLGGLDYVNERPSGPGVTSVHKDWFGQSWTFEEKVAATNPTPGVSLLHDITEWEDIIKWPTFDKLDWEGRSAAATATWDREKRLSKVVSPIGMWERMFSIMPFTDALMALVEEPEACAAFASAYADHKIRLHDYVIDYYKPDVLCMHDDYGSAAHMFMSVPTWEEVFKPALQKIIDHVRSRGVMYEHHCCGVMAPIAGQMADMGMVSWNNANPCNNMENYMDLASKVALVGAGLDGVYLDRPSTTDEDIVKHIHDSMDFMVSYGPIVFSAMCPNHKERNPLIAEEILRYGQQFYNASRPE